MKGWRSKLIFMLIVYIAGFATAIYMLAPTPEGDANRTSQNTAIAGFQSEEFVKSFNSGMHKCLAFGKDAAIRTSEFIRDKIKEMREA